MSSMLPIEVTLTPLEPHLIGGAVAIEIVGIDCDSKHVVKFRCVTNDPDRVWRWRDATDTEVAIASILTAAREAAGIDTP